MPPRWVELVRHTLTTLRPQVQATRMVREYVEDWYVPAARAAAEIAADGFAAARELAAYRARLGAAWPRVKVAGVDASGLPDTPVVGAPMTVRAAVQLAGLDPADVCVEAVVGRVDESDDLSDAVIVQMKHDGPTDGDAASGSRRWCRCRTPGWPATRCGCCRPPAPGVGRGAGQDRAGLS